MREKNFIITPSLHNAHFYYLLELYNDGCLIIAVVLEDTELSSVLLEHEFAIGSTDQISCVEIPITNDEALEDDHEFNVTITGAGSSPHASLGTPTVTTVIIKDDESEYLSMINIIFCDVM